MSITFKFWGEWQDKKIKHTSKVVSKLSKPLFRFIKTSSKLILRIQLHKRTTN